MFKVNYENTRMMSVNIFHYFAPFSNVFIVDIEQVNASWELLLWNIRISSK